jgi:hypothetical protein
MGAKSPRLSLPQERTAVARAASCFCTPVSSVSSCREEQNFSLALQQVTEGLVVPLAIWVCGLSACRTGSWACKLPESSGFMERMIMRNGSAFSSFIHHFASLTKRQIIP